MKKDDVRIEEVPIDKIKPDAHLRFYNWFRKRFGVDHLFMSLDDWLSLKYHFLEMKFKECIECKRGPLLVQLLKEKDVDHWELLEVCLAFATILKLWKLDREVATSLLDEWAEQDVV